MGFNEDNIIMTVIKNDRIKKVIITTVFAVITLLNQLEYMCSMNYYYVSKCSDLLILTKIHPADIDIDWYVLDRGSKMYRNLGLSDDVVREIGDSGSRESPNVDYVDVCSFGDSVDFVEAPYKLHIVRCKMSDENDMTKGLDITVDSYTDSHGVTHQEEHTIVSYNEHWRRGDFRLISLCYEKNAEKRFGTIKVPGIRQLPYMPILKPDPYLGDGYYLWANYIVKAEVIFCVYALFSLLAVLDKPERYRWVKVYAVLSIICCVWFSLFIFL